MTCKLCTGPLVLLGRLANMKHYRCRDCGMMFCKPAPKRNLY